MSEHVILVDQNDNILGSAEKMAAHRNNLCHRAFSVFILRGTSQMEVLLQQRSSNKYHSPLLWTNTCCSHPRPKEDIIAAGQRRLKEEMGIDASLQGVGRFHYIAHFDNGLVENEVDHVLVGFIDNQTFHPNPDEVADYRWIEWSALQNELQTAPKHFTPWFKQALSFVAHSQSKTAGYAHPHSMMLSSLKKESSMPL